MIQIIKTVACGLAWQNMRSNWVCLDFPACPVGRPACPVGRLAPPFALRQKVEEEKPNPIIQITDNGEVWELKDNK